MRMVNKAYLLPDPPAWHRGMFDRLKKAIAKFGQVLRLLKKQPFRVR